MKRLELKPQASSNVKLNSPFLKKEKKTPHSHPFFWEGGQIERKQSVVDIYTSIVCIQQPESEQRKYHHPFHYGIY